MKIALCPPHLPTPLFCQLLLHNTYHYYTPLHLHNLLNLTIRNPTTVLKHATQLHSQIITNNFIPVPSLFNTLLTLYSKCRHINQALLLFSSSSQRVSNNIVTWTTLITQLSHFNKPLLAFNFFNRMRRTGIHPNHFTFSAMLPVCSLTMILCHGQQMHSLICKHGYEAELFVGSSLLDMYAKCDDMASAIKVFDNMPQRNLVSWNSMIVGFLHNTLYDSSFLFFKEILRDESIIPDQVSFSSVLSSCANMGAVRAGKQVHGVAIKHGLIMLPYVRNSLLDLYCKCCLFPEAAALFQTMVSRDVVAWNVMIMGCSHNGYFEEGYKHFLSMKREGVMPDEASYSSVLHGSANFATLNQGSSIHNQVIKSGFLMNAWVSSSLITMYAKCGSFAYASRVFGDIEKHNAICWTAMISACQQHGRANQVIQLFEEMLGEGLKPDYVTFVCVISACSHTGRVEEGYIYFNSMKKVYDMSPQREHYACMVDLLGRAGRLEEAKIFIESMPLQPDSTTWGALLGACTNHGNLEMGRVIAKRLFELEPHNAGNYVMLSNIRIMRDKGIRKDIGCSWIDIRNSTFVFTAHDTSHPLKNKIDEMLRKLEDLVKQKGYVPEAEYAVNSGDGSKEKDLWYHSEKLALAYALLALPAGQPILIKKNLRTCGDCHTVMKFASDIFNRDIIVRDINRFHHFSGAFCSCGDYW
ncbi:hypothetical protein K2173_027009 [Erythroxylum novogranatense]|uniref:DYW domain-containing protein n=1 Tax=Erythroxylum novogranatense TaxID=1862640 RepID=A0AAV8TXR6_9ROSI|nr:hypothetical protein K2173_027009 [Erythroxylum novogranatense]